VNTQNIPTIFKQTGIIPTNSFETADIIFTHNHDQFFKLNTINTPICKYVYGLRSINLFASKSTLAKLIREIHPEIIPKTWILDSKEDLLDLKNQFDQFKKPIKDLILKSNVQRQTGLKIVQHMSDITNEFVVCQEILKNPLLILGRKIDIRVYMLIICDNHQSKLYIYNNGFIYYTREDYSKNISFDNIISSGYIDRSIYDTHPLTLHDLYKYIGQKHSSDLKYNIEECFTKLYKCYKPFLKRNDIDDGVNRFILMGADISPNNEYGVKLLEINKGPDLTTKGVRDKELKDNLAMDTIKQIRNRTKSSCNFTEII
jgi:hypothetical protein